MAKKYETVTPSAKKWTFVVTDHQGVGVEHIIWAGTETQAWTALRHSIGVSAYNAAKDIRLKRNR